MVFKYTHYTTCITLNVSQTGCTVMSQLGFEAGSLVWRAGSLPTKSSGPAGKTKELTKKNHDKMYRISHCFCNEAVGYCPTNEHVYYLPLSSCLLLRGVTSPLDTFLFLIYILYRDFDFQDGCFGVWSI